MFKYFSYTKIQNYKYEINNLNNSSVLDEKVKHNLDKYSKVIDSTKYISRVYFFLEVLNFTNKLFRNKIVGNKLASVAFIYIRLNVMWIASNVCLNYYLSEISGLDKIIKKYKNLNKEEFIQYIRH